MIAHLRVAASLLCGILATALVAQVAYADTITVDVNLQGDYSSLSLGLYWASAGDTILVYPGEYTGSSNRELTMPAWDVTLMSRDGPETTLLNLEGYPGIFVDQAQTVSTVIDGFTLTDVSGYGNYGILVSNGAGCTIRNCIFTEGATLRTNAAGTTRIRGCEFANNYYGARLHDCTQASVRNCVFRDNGYGFAASNDGPSSELTVSRCEFDANVRALSITAHGYVEVDSCSVSSGAHGEYSWQSGTSTRIGAYGSSSIHINSCTFTDNYSTRDAGAAEVYVYSGYAEFNNCLFADNHAVGYGGAIQNSLNRVTVIGCTFSRNTAWTGGAISTGVEGGTGLADIVDCVFEDNEAEFGGAIAALHEYNAVSGCDFRGNKADMGGAIWGRDNHTRISDCLFAGNTGYVWGAGVCFMDVRTGSAVQIDDSTFDGNRAHRGAAVMLDNSIGTVRGCTLFGNRPDDASIVFTRTADVDVERCVMSFAASGVPLLAELGSSVDVTKCVVFGNAGGDSLDGDLVHPVDNIFDDPLLCDVSAADYSLCANSPCLPENNPWSVQIGAHSEGCASCDSPIELTTWGAIKAMYR
jgi:hypothetical protein